MSKNKIETAPKQNVDNAERILPYTFPYESEIEARAFEFAKKDGFSGKFNEWKGLENFNLREEYILKYMASPESGTDKIDELYMLPEQRQASLDISQNINETVTACQNKADQIIIHSLEQDFKKNDDENSETILDPVVYKIFGEAIKSTSEINHAESELERLSTEKDAKEKALSEQDEKILNKSLQFMADKIPVLGNIAQNILNRRRKKPQHEIESLNEEIKHSTKIYRKKYEKEFYPKWNEIYWEKKDELKEEMSKRVKKNFEELSEDNIKNLFCFINSLSKAQRQLEKLAEEEYKESPLPDFLSEVSSQSFLEYLINIEKIAKAAELIQKLNDQYQFYEKNPNIENLAIANFKKENEIDQRYSVTVNNPLYVNPRPLSNKLLHIATREEFDAAAKTFKMAKEAYAKHQKQEEEMPVWARSNTVYKLWREIVLGVAQIIESRGRWEDRVLGGPKLSVSHASPQENAEQILKKGIIHSHKMGTEKKFKVHGFSPQAKHLKVPTISFAIHGVQEEYTASKKTFKVIEEGDPEGMIFVFPYTYTVAENEFFEWPNTQLTGLEEELHIIDKGKGINIKEGAFLIIHKSKAEKWQKFLIENGYKKSWIEERVITYENGKELDQLTRQHTSLLYKKMEEKQKKDPQIFSQIHISHQKKDIIYMPIAEQVGSIDPRLSQYMLNPTAVFRAERLKKTN